MKKETIIDNYLKYIGNNRQFRNWSIINNLISIPALNWNSKQFFSNLENSPGLVIWWKQNVLILQVQSHNIYKHWWCTTGSYPCKQIQRYLIITNFIRTNRSIFKLLWLFGTSLTIAQGLSITRNAWDRYVTICVSGIRVLIRRAASFRVCILACCDMATI